MLIEQLCSLLEGADVLAAGEARNLLDSLPATTRPTDADTFADWLIKKGRLTRFQFECIREGSGHTLALGSYLILDKLGDGGMGAVYRAVHRHMKRPVAIKVIKPELVNSPEAKRRFQREVEAQAKLDHPNIVGALDAGQEGDSSFLVMRLVDGNDLSSIVKQRGPLPVVDAVNYIAQAARGLAYAHEQGIVHRDIKPSNLLLDASGTVKILDLGLATFLTTEPGTDDSLTHSRMVGGTPDYMAPEQARGLKYADQRSDIYSLGLTLWYLLTGKVAYDAENLMAKLVAHRKQPIPSLSAARPDAPAALDAVFRKMVAKQPAERYATMAEVATALQNSASARTESTLPPHTPLSEIRPSRFAIPVAVSVLAVLSLCFWSVFQYRHRWINGIDRPHRDGDTGKSEQTSRINGVTSTEKPQIGDKDADLTARGWELMKERRFEEAEAAFRTTIRLNPNDPLSLFGMGSALHAQRKLDEAEVPLREAIRLNPDHWESYHVLAWIYYRQKRFSEMESLCREVLGREHNLPAASTALADLGWSLYEQGKLDEARKQLSEALQLNASNESAHDCLGWVHITQLRFTEAEAEFRAVVRIQPDKANGYFGVGKALVEQGKYSDAERHLREALRIDPVHRYAGELLERASQGQGNTSAFSTSTRETKPARDPLDTKQLQQPPFADRSFIQRLQDTLEIVVDHGGHIAFHGRPVTRVQDFPKVPVYVHRMWVGNQDQNLKELMPRLKEVPYLGSLQMGHRRIDREVARQLVQLPTLWTLSLDDTDISDDSVAILSGLPDLRVLDLSRTKISDAALRAVGNNKHLRTLYLADTAISDAGLKELSDHPNLRILLLVGVRAITKDGLAALQSLPSLQTLDLAETSLDDSAVDVLAQFSQLRLLDISDTRISAYGAQLLRRSLPHTVLFHPDLPQEKADQLLAEWASVRGVAIGKDQAGRSGEGAQFALNSIGIPEDVSLSEAGPYLDSLRCVASLDWGRLKTADNAAQQISKMDSLLSLKLDHSDLTGKGLSRLSKLTQLQTLVLSNCAQLANEDLAHLARFQCLGDLTLDRDAIGDQGCSFIGGISTLDTLNLNNCPEITAQGVLHLGKLHHLRLLGLQGASIDDSAVPYFGTLKSLRILRLESTKMTAGGIRALHEALPTCVVVWDGGVVYPDLQPSVADEPKERATGAPFGGSPMPPDGFALEFNGKDSYVELPLHYDGWERFTLEATISSYETERRGDVLSNAAGVGGAIEFPQGARNSAQNSRLGLFTIKDNGWTGIRTLRPPGRWPADPRSWSYGRIRN